MSGAHGGPRGSQSGERRGLASSAAAVKQLNQQITQATSLQDLIHAVVVNFGRMNGVNFCTAYHRIAKHVEELRRGRQPPEAWPPAQQRQLGELLGQLNTALVPRLGEVQAHNLGLTLWSISKTCQLAPLGSTQLVEALQAEITHRLVSASSDTYLRDKHYNFGAQALSNVVYSNAAMGLRPNYELLHAVARGVDWQIDEFKPQGLANIIWGLGKMGVRPTPEVRQMVEVLGRELTAQLTHARHKGSVAPQNVSNTLHGLTHMGIAPAPELLSALAQGAGGMLRQFGPQELTNSVWSLSQMWRAGVPFTPDVNALLDRIPDELLLLLSDRSWRARVTPQTISNLALAYAHLHRAPQMLMMELMVETLPMLPKFKPQELSNLLWAMATMSFYPGTTTVDAITRAAGAAAERMKPQEIANTCWAWATMRHFPGAALLDGMLACAEAQLEWFKSQELGMLCWAVAKLAYMPAAPLVRAALPHLVACRSPAVQDCGNMLWAFTVLNILTPEVMRQLSDRLLSLPREAFTQEAYIQLYQAKMSLSQQVFDIAQHIPAELLAQAETEWRRQSGEYKVSMTHRDVATVMRQLSIEFEMEKKIEDGLMSVDIALRGEMVAVEVDGSAHFSVNEPFVPLGRTIWRWRLLASRGWRVVTVPYYRWTMLQSVAQKKQFLYMLLQCHSVWDCISLDPQNRDAPLLPPANLCHLTPDEVLHSRVGSANVSPLLAAASASASAATSAATSTAPSPATPLPAGLGPAAGGTSSVGSASATSSVGLPASLLPMPVSLVPPPGLALAPGSGYGRLPDNLYSSDSPTGGVGRSPAPQSGPSRFGSSGSSSAGLNVSARPFSFGMGSGAGPSGSCSSGHGGASGAAAYRSSGSRTGGGIGSGGSRTASPTVAASQLLQLGNGFGGSYSLAPSAPAFFPPLPPADAMPAGSPALTRGSGLSGSGSSPARSLPSSTAASPALPPFAGLRAQPTQQQHQQQQLSSPAVGGLRSTPKAPPGLRSPSPAVVAGPGLPDAGLSKRAGSGETFPPPPVLAAPAQLGGLDDDSDDDVGDLRSFFGSVIGASAQQPKDQLSVEEVRRKLALLPADVAMADVAPAWLAGWDAEGVVELLCQLDTPTTAARALQLFEWLRSLAADSPQAHLCTPATYAAMISLFGRWRKPKQAVRLFAELKERGEDGAEVHSALVEAFCSCGQAEVAMDAFHNMVSQGLAPSPAAAQAMLQQHMQRGALGEVDAVLAAMVMGAELEGGTAGDDDAAALDAELFNSVIDHACAAGSTPAAMSAYERMCQAGVAPTPSTFAALLPALRQQHPAAEQVAEQAMGLAEQAGEAAGQALRAVHQACRARGWWDISLALLRAAEEGGSRPGLEEVNNALAACSQGGAVSQARQAFDLLARYGLQPSADSYLALVQAHCNAGQWAAGAREYDAMLAAGLAPSEDLISLVVDALWCSGLPWAQGAALAAFNQAISAGWLAPARASKSRSLLKLDLHARHLGTGLLLMRRWLHSTRASIGNSSAGDGQLDVAKRLCVVSSAAEGADPSAASTALACALKDALGASLVLHRAPFRVTYEDGKAQRMESSTFMAKKWLFTDAFHEWERAFAGRAAQAAAAAAAAGEAGAEPGGGVPWLPLAALEREEQLQQEFSQRFALVLEYEAAHPPPGPGAAPSLGGQRRRQVAEVVCHLAAGMGLGGAAQQLWHAALVLLDRLAAAGHRPSTDAVMAAACVALAAQREGIPLDLPALAGQLDRGVMLYATDAEPEAALEAEMERAGAVLRGDTFCMSALRCWKLYAQRLQCDVEDEAQASALLGDSLALLNRLALEDERFCTAHPPSIQAAAVLYVARKQAGMVPFWPGVLQQLTGYREEQHPQFTAALRELQKTSQYGSAVVQAVYS